MCVRRFEACAAPRPVGRACLTPDIGTLLFKLCRCRGKPSLRELALQTLHAPTARKELRLDAALFQHADRAGRQHLIAFNGGVSAAMSGSHSLAPPGCQMSDLRAFSEI